MAPKREVKRDEKESGDSLSRVKSLLTSDEKYVNHYKVGTYTIVESNMRITYSRKWPRVFMKMPFSEFRRLEYFTKIDWANLVKFLIYAGVAVFLMLWPELLWEKVIGYYFPFVTKLLSLDKPFDYLVISYILMFIFYLLAFIALVRFISWLIGRLIIESSKRVEPLEIICRFTDDVKDFMKEIEPKIKRKE